MKNRKPLEFTEKTALAGKRTTEANLLKFKSAQKRKNKAGKQNLIDIAAQAEKQLSKLISATAVKKYDKTRAVYQSALFKESVKHLGNPKDQDELSNKAITLFKREIFRNLPRVKPALAIRKKANLDLNKVYTKFFGPGSDLVDSIAVDGIDSFYDWSDEDNNGVTRYAPPYLFGETHNELVLNYFDSVNDESFFDAAAGFISNKVSTVFTEDGLGSFNPPAVYDSYVSLGVNYTVPSTGIVRVDVLIQNTFNRQYIRLKDKFGFSDGKVNLWQNLHMIIMHPNNLHASEINMSHLNLESDGDDKTASKDDLMTTMPYALRFQSSGSFIAGTELQILIGSNMETHCKQDDMKSETLNEFSWVLKEINVRII